MALYFPSLEWFQTIQQVVNDDPEFRRLGSVDAKVGMKIEEAIFLLQFRAFRCESVQAGTDDDLFEVDFYIELSAEQWQEMLENIKQHGSADHKHTLNSLDLSTGGIANNATGDQYKLDLFFRYNESLQYFFDRSAQLDTVFQSSATT